MTRDTIDMAREAGSQEYGPLTRNWSFELTQLKAFEALVRADERDKWMERAHTMILGEREACAKVCEGRLEEGLNFEGCAAAIRARGNT